MRVSKSTKIDLYHVLTINHISLSGIKYKLPAIMIRDNGLNY